MIYYQISGVFTMPKGIPNKRYSVEFKRHVVETMREEGLSYRETERRFELPSKRAAAWERIYLEEGAEGFHVEHRGRSSTGRPRKLPKEVEEDLLAEVQRLRAENDYLKNLQALVLEDERR
ncbi:MAG: transposase, partial [Aristaeellaceae bacterium]